MSGRGGRKGAGVATTVRPAGIAVLGFGGYANPQVSQDCIGPHTHTHT